MKTISQRLKVYRLKKGLNQKEVAHALGISPSTYRDWEYGTAIQGEPYLKLAAILGIPLVELMTGERSGVREILLALSEIERVVEDTRRIVLAAN